ncbi:MAG: ankyrin repeat domain-containing protein [Candidatus Dependentiae bacterium]|nr:ankyrin repeat domain-containing protein [Candidatus Dependentiae bacterium]
MNSTTVTPSAPGGLDADSIIALVVGLFLLAPEIFLLVIACCLVPPVLCLECCFLTCFIPLALCLMPWLMGSGTAFCLGRCLRCPPPQLGTVHLIRTLLAHLAAEYGLTSLMALTTDFFSSERLLNGRLFGKTLLERAVTKGHLDVVKYLIERCYASVGRCDEEQNTILHSTILGCKNRSKAIPLIGYLIEKFPDMLTAKNKQGKTPFELLLKKYRARVLPKLIQQSAFPTLYQDAYEGNLAAINGFYATLSVNPPIRLPDDVYLGRLLPQNQTNEQHAWIITEFGKKHIDTRDLRYFAKNLWQALCRKKIHKKFDRGNNNILKNEKELWRLNLGKSDRASRDLRIICGT